MKEYIKLELKFGKVINETKGGFSKDFFYPFTYHHVYNMCCTLLDKNPIPQNRKVDNKYMPFYQNIMDAVLEGYIKIESISEDNVICSVKSAHNSNATNDATKQITWQDVELTMQDKFHDFKNILNDVFKIKYDVAYIKGFENTMSDIISWNNILDIDNLKNWFKTNKLTAFVNYIENDPNYKGTPLNKNGKITTLQMFQLSKKVYRGIIKSNVYNAIIYIPFNNELKETYLKYSKGWTNMLDGGLVKSLGFHELSELDIIDFYKINSLKTIRKSDVFNMKEVDFEKNEKYKFISNNIKKNLQITKNDVSEMLQSLNLSFDENDLDKLFKKKIEVKEITGFIKKLRNEKFWSLDKVKEILNELNVQYDLKDLENIRFNANSINNRIEQIINKNLKIN